MNDAVFYINLTIVLFILAHCVCEVIRHIYRGEFDIQEFPGDQ